jgi:hypothetical protein
MNASIRIFRAALAFTACAGALAVSLFARPLELSSQPDTIVLRDGSQVRGLIVRNVRGEVTIQTASGEETYQRNEIARIHDYPGEGEYLTNIERKGELPPWRTIVNDLRHSDKVRSFEQIPATVVDTGDFKNVPYLSFRVNGSVELNIYGDPEDPAGIEMGIYGAQQGNTRIRRIIREFLSAYLNSRDEIEAVYQLDKNGGRRDVGDMTIEYTPANAPDAYGAWWLSIYNRKHLAKARLTDAEYAKLSVPVDTVLNRKGQVRDTAWTQADKNQSLRLSHSGNKRGERLFVRGFYRDKDGNFRVITEPGPTPRS